MSNFKLIKKITKKWTSGLTTFAIIGDGEHTDRNYIILERILTGKESKNQQFNLRLKDWNNLKELIEEETVEFHKWPVEMAISSESTLLNSLENF